MNHKASLLGLIITLVIGAAAADDFDSKGVKIHYTIEGAGPPVVLIHGYHASGAMNWGPNGVIKELAKRYRVITLDNRGHGRSDKPESEKDYGENMAEDVIRLLDHLKIDKASMVGYSMGGMITLNLLAKHPNRIECAIVGGMGWLPYNDQPLPQPPIRRGETKDPLVACRRAFGRLGITKEELKEIKTPMVVIIGSDDRLKGRVDALKQVRSDIPVVEIAGKNHLSCVLAPEFRQAISEFLDKNVNPGK